MNKFKVAPLSAGFFLLSMLGFFLGIFVIWPVSATWGLLIVGFSLVMFFASMVSLTMAPVEEELLLDEPISERRKRIRILSKKEYEEQFLKKASSNSSSKPQKSKYKKTVVKKTQTKKTMSKKPLTKNVVNKKSGKKAVNKPTTKKPSKTTTKKK
jgi:hypothetical protein